MFQFEFIDLFLAKVAMWFHDFIVSESEEGWRKIRSFYMIDKKASVSITIKGEINAITNNIGNFIVQVS